MKSLRVVSFLVIAAAWFAVAPSVLLAGPSSTDAESGQGFRLVKTEGSLAHYKGSAIVSGRYHEKLRESEIGNFEAGLICFSVKGETEKWIPRENDSRSPWFCFSNTADARSMLGFASKVPDGTCYVVGVATVQISEYVANRADTEVHDTAKLDRVIGFEKPDFKKECSIY